MPITDIFDDISWGDVKDYSGAVGSIGGGIGSLLSAFRRRDPFSEIPGLRESIQTSVDRRAYAAALAEGPANPRFANLARIFEEQFRSEGIRGLREKMALQQRLMARGASPGLFTSERRDEAANRATMELFARAKAMGVGAASNNLKAAMGTQGSVDPATFALLSRYGSDAFNRPGNITDALAKLLGASGGVLAGLGEKESGKREKRGGPDYGGAYRSPSNAWEVYGPPTGGIGYSNPGNDAWSSSAIPPYRNSGDDAWSERYGI